MNTRAFAALAVVTCGLVIAPSARAAGVGELPLRPTDRAYLASSVVFSASPSDDQVSTLHVAPQLSGGVRIGSRLAATLDLTLGWTSFQITGEERRRALRLGNPFITLQAALLERTGQSLWIGLGAAPPLVTLPGTIPRNTEAKYNALTATAARGFGGHWLWAPNVVPIALLIHTRAELAIPVIVGAELEPAILVSVNSNPSRVAAAADAFVGYRLGPIVPSARLQLFVRSEPLARRDFSQWAAALRVDAEHGAFFARAEAVANLDAPFGLAHQRGATIWGTMIGAGFRR